MEQVEMIESVVILLVASSIYLLSTSNDLLTLLVNVLYYFAHIFAAGFSSGIYGCNDVYFGRYHKMIIYFVQTKTGKRAAPIEGKYVQRIKDLHLFLSIC